MAVSAASTCRGMWEKNPGMSREEIFAGCKDAGFDLKESSYRVYKSLWAKKKSSVDIVPEPTVNKEATVILEETVNALYKSLAEQVTEDKVVIEDKGVVPVKISEDIPDNLRPFFSSPTIDDSHIINEDLTCLFDAVHKASDIEPQNIRLTGPAGCGKTTTAMEFAARYKRPLLVMDCPNVREPRDWFGFKDVDPITGHIYWHKSLFYRFVQQDGAVIVLDEINRINPMVINTLLPLLDGRRSTYLEEAKEKISVGKGVVFFSTTNEGREFTGTIQLDLAQADRLCTKIECSYLVEKDEVKLVNKRTNLPIEECKKLVQVANHVRRKFMSDSSESFSQNISTRMLLNAGQKMHLAGPKTLRYTLLSHFNEDGKEQSERAQLLKLLTGKFGPVV
jgi:hypothetical protein